MPRESFEIGPVRVRAGRAQALSLPITRLVTGAEVDLPVRVVHGREDGPTVWVDAAVHGDEAVGVEVVRQVLAGLDPKTLRGTLIAVPIVNVLGFMSGSRYLPDRRDLNRSFPGSPKGSMAARLANLLVTGILPSCTHLIDLHTGAVGRENLPQVRGCFNMGGTLADMAKAFNAPVLLDLGLRPGTFRETAHNLGIPSLVYEAGEALRFNEVSIRAGVSGILNVMSHLGMIRKRVAKKAHQPIFATSTQWIRASQSGVTRSLVTLGEKVETGQTLAYISDPFGEHEEELASTAAGIVIGRTRLPLVHEGEAVFHIAKFSKPMEAVESIENFQDAFDPVTGTSDSEEPPLV